MVCVRKLRLGRGEPDPLLYPSDSRKEAEVIFDQKKKTLVYIYIFFFTEMVPSETSLRLRPSNLDVEDSQARAKERTLLGSFGVI